MLTCPEQFLKMYKLRSEISCKNCGNYAKLWNVFTCCCVLKFRCFIFYHDCILTNDVHKFPVYGTIKVLLYCIVSYCIVCVCSPGCTDSIVTSDHKPVFASFDVAILGQFVSEKGTAAQPGDKEIIFDAIKTEVS